MTMKCVICKHGEMRPGFATVTLDRKDAVVVVREVPALICDNCGEQFVDEKVAANVLRQANDAVKVGDEVQVRAYAAA